MSKKHIIKYNFSGNEDDYKKLLRQFTLDKLLIRISQESINLLSHKSEHLFGVEKKSYTMVNAANGIPKEQELLVSAWGLVDLAYDAIGASNDYRGDDVDDVNDTLYLLISASQQIKENRESKFLSSLPQNDKKDDFLLYLWGFAGEQFKMEMLGKAFVCAARELYILFESAKRVKDIPNICSIVLDEMGMPWQRVVTALFLAWAMSTVTPKIEEAKKCIIWDEGFSEKDFDKVIERYTENYEAIRGSELGRQILYTKPYVKTQRGEIISVNCFLALLLYEHSILWMVRDNYNKRGDQGFISAFGYCFEAYLAELLEEYVERTNYEKLPEAKTKRADWKLCLGEYKILIEQKSNLLGLAAKQSNPDIDMIKTFAERSVIKAIHQLNNTEKELNDGKYIKIILLYEDYLQSEILENFFALDSCDVENDHYYWLVTIEEMEILLYTYKNDPQCFDSIMQEKIKRELECSKDGRGLLFLLNNAGINVNLHMAQEQFKKYEKFAENEVRKNLQSKDDFLPER